MDWIIILGALSLGLLIGAMVGWYFNSGVATARVLAASVSAVAGSSILAMFSFLAGFRGPTHEYWFYPVGLLIGFMTVTIIEIKLFGYAGEKYDDYMKRGKKR